MEICGYRQALELIERQYPNRITITPKEIAKLFGVDPKTVYQACKQKKNPLPCVRFSKRKILIPISELATWMAERSSA